MSSAPIKQVFSVVTDFYSQAEGGVWQAGSARPCGGGFRRAVVTHDHQKLSQQHKYKHRLFPSQLNEPGIKTPGCWQVRVFSEGPGSSVKVSFFSF